ncbi:hypothetical protein FQN60_009664 [Etheostoma spectabile]|uniref:Ribonuclease A-domain domain-containing protein n=1 Tax=Etheostoma spectabile TaxID=54343 RepID=A0A5J5DJW0_9PERO|nr:hypothetical protein FQN60_009664 [Etheostoma spectabile]
MKISIFAGVLLISAAVLSDKVKHDVAWFTNQHIADEMHESDCANVINGRGIMKDNGGCKWSNTFIKASLDTVTGVCKTPLLNPKSNLHRSTGTFTLIHCEQTKEMAQKKAKSPDCEYKEGEVKTEKTIVIGCDTKGNPIHFEEFEPK